MASQLRKKLEAIMPASPHAAAQSRGGVYFCADRSPLDVDFSAKLSNAALARMDLSEGFSINDCLFLDTETTGLSGGAGTIAFLVGAGYVDGTDFVVEQFLMRDYSDEPEMLLKLSKLFSRFTTLVTFNGRTFDMPLLEARYTICRMRMLLPHFAHIDLLHLARRVWKLRLGSCRLSALEAQILHRPRTDDLPGKEVPERYFRYLSTGDFSLLKDVLGHNRQDIKTLITLLGRLFCAYGAPEREEYPQDLFSLARALEKRSDTAAKNLYHLSALPRAAGPLRPGNSGCEALANWRLSEMYRKEGDFAQMRLTLEKMALRRQLGPVPHIALSKDYEHRRKDPRRALKHAQCALALADTRQFAQIEKRIARLEKKLRKNQFREECK